jgi:hypothetical protein
MGPYIRDEEGMGKGSISLLAMSDQVRAWPGGTSGFKLGLKLRAWFRCATLRGRSWVTAAAVVACRDGRRSWCETV